MKVKLAYGKEGLTVELPDKNVVKILTLKDFPAIENPEKAVFDKLQSPVGSLPLAELAQGKETACIVVSDITRPVPNKVIVPPILTVLEENGIKRENLSILIATGIHRPAPDSEIREILGDYIAENYNVVNHYAHRLEDTTFLGVTPEFNAPMHVNTLFIEADLKIVTGLIEPHLMAGYSGGRKAIVPGISAFETVKVLHGPTMMGHPNVVEGVIAGNPFHEESLYVAKEVGVDFIVNVTINDTRDITGIFCGGLEEAHTEGMKFAEEQTMDTVEEPVDCVITSGSGYPLDLTYYQATKGVTAAVPIVKKGGVIILASQCLEGIGGPEFTYLVLNTETCEKFMENIKSLDYYVQDQWQLQKLCNAKEKAEVWLYSDGIDSETKKKLFARPISSIEEGVKEILARFGEDATIAVIPKGPYVLARIAG